MINYTNKTYIYSNILIKRKDRYVNIMMPFYFFIVDEPDGNEIEVTGN